MSTCSQCGAAVGADMLACPACHRLVHRDRLEQLARQASERAPQAPDEARALWREALSLLPKESQQYQQIASRIEALTPNERAVAAAASEDRKTPKWLASLGAVGLLLWKLKPLALFVATKGKMLLLGLTKWKTLFSMFLALGVYWSIWGWWFALGFVLSIYVHEMGHVAALRHYGIAASAPMFIPGVGAFVRLKELPRNAIEDARVGLAGPWWGLGAALLCYLVFLLTELSIFAALAKIGGWINLFNLVPIWQLDGGRGFRSMTRKQRLWALGVIVVALLFSGETMLWLLLLGALFRVVKGPFAETPDRAGWWSYAALVAALSVLASLSVPGLDTGP